MKIEPNFVVHCPHCKTVYKKRDYDNLKTDVHNYKICAHCQGSFKVTSYIEGVNWSGNSITISAYSREE